ncbi:MAG: antifreeze protein, partial [Alphaproteobacteria bacterium]|nr:antifreeze protein [Alphaproteobacteria bacterium]
TPEQAERRNAVLLGLLDALGQRVPTEFWLQAFDTPWQVPTIAPRPSLWHALHLAAENLRLAETVLVALVALGDEGPALTDPTNLYRVVGSLRLVGFDAEARALAVEAAIANGV